MTLSIYYLPKLSSISDKAELREELLQGYKIIMPIVIVMALVIYFFRDIIISVLFTESFSPMSELFFYQLIGSVIKVSALLLAYIMVAKAMTKLYIVSELASVASFVALSIYFMDMYGLIGVTMAFMVNYLIYTVFIYFSLRGYLK